MGNTTSQVEPYPITTNKDAAIDWFMSNLEKNKYEFASLTATIKKQIGIPETATDLTTEQVKTLLKGNQITLES
ncbi:MAG: hypothetical protein WCH65_05065 [bacterium]